MGLKNKLDKEWWEALQSGIKGKDKTESSSCWGTVGADNEGDSFCTINKGASKVEGEYKELEFLLTVEGKLVKKETLSH